MRRLEIQLPAWLDRVPAVSLGLATTWLIVALVVGVVYGPARDEADERVRTAVHYALDNPAVAIHTRLLPAVRAVMPGFESNEMFAFLRNAESRGEGATLQEQFDLLAARAFESLDAHPYRRLGVVPADLAVHAFVTHPFVHSGWLHLLATLPLWLLAAPLLEQLWGKRVFAGALLLLSLAGGGVFALAHGAGDRALVGASSLLAGLVAAALVRFRDRKSELDLLGWLRPGVEAELVAPVWVLGALWLGYEVSLWWTVQGTLPGGLDNAVGYAAHAAAIAVGAGLPLAIEKLGWEERFGRAPEVAVASQASSRFDFDRVLKLRAQGDADAAFQMLAAEVGRSARNRDAVTTFWQMCIERGESERATLPMRQLIREELRRGAEEVAVAHWRELAEHSPAARLDAATLLRLLPVIQRVDGDEHAVLALQQCGSQPPGSLDSGQAAEAARLASDLDGPLAGELARRALEGEALDAAGHKEMDALARRFAPRAEDDFDDLGPAGEEPDPDEDKTLEPSVFYQESDRSAFGEVGDLSALDAEFPRGVVAEAVPQALEPKGVRVAREGAEETIGYERVRAVAAAGVHGLSSKPVVLIDLLVDGGGSSRPLGVLRFRSDRYDPRPLVPQAPGPLEALSALVRTILEQSRGRPLPDPEGALLKPVRIFASLAEYEDQVLRPLGSELA